MVGREVKIHRGRLDKEILADRAQLFHPKTSKNILKNFGNFRKTFSFFWMVILKIFENLDFFRFRSFENDSRFSILRSFDFRSFDPSKTKKVEIFRKFPKWPSKKMKIFFEFFQNFWKPFFIFFSAKVAHDQRESPYPISRDEFSLLCTPYQWICDW